MLVLMCRSLAVHPSLPYLLSASDDMLIKLWDWDKVLLPTCKWVPLAAILLLHSMQTQFRDHNIVRYTDSDRGANEAFLFQAQTAKQESDIWLERLKANMAWLRAKEEYEFCIKMHSTTYLWYRSAVVNVEKSCWWLLLKIDVVCRAGPVTRSLMGIHTMSCRYV